MLSASDINNPAADANNPHPYALLPNPKYFVSTASIPYTTFGGVGGANEDYDAPDPQNMFLAWIPVNAAPNQMLPSFHRPDLVNYWANVTPQGPPAGMTQLPSWATNYALQRQVILRPLNNPTDHPYFTGSNPSFNPIVGPWDVDNDNDGQPESVWVDVGFPVQTAPDGKLYKPLFAFLIVDMDGRLNVNAHGNITQTQWINTTNQQIGQVSAQGPFAITQNSAVSPNSYVAAQQNSVQLPRGQGYGPAEINLGIGMSNTVTQNAVFLNTGVATGQEILQQLFVGNTGSTAPFNVSPWTRPAYVVDGRYGELGYNYTLPEFNGNGNTGILASCPLPGYTGLTTGTTPVSLSDADDVLSALKHFEIPQNYFTPSGNSTVSPSTWMANFTCYGTPPDLWGRGSVGIDYRGQPIYAFSPTHTTGTGPNELPNSPYAFNLSKQGVRATETMLSNDNPFTPAELERVVAPLRR